MTTLLNLPPGTPVLLQPFLSSRHRKETHFAGTQPTVPCHVWAQDGKLGDSGLAQLKGRGIYCGQVMLLSRDITANCANAQLARKMETKDKRSATVA